MLIGLTWAVPRVTPTLGWMSTDLVGMPHRPGLLPGTPRSSRAWITLFGPSGMASTMSTKAVLTEFSVASTIETAEP